MRIYLALVLWGAAMLPAAAATAPEEVDVFASTSLPGFWRIALPGSAEFKRHADVLSGNVGEFTDDNLVMTDHLSFGSARDQLCRIGKAQDKDTMMVQCLGFGSPGGGTVEAGNGQFSMAWTAKNLRLSLRGTLPSFSRFESHFTLEQAGNRHLDPDTLGGAKFDLTHTGEDEAGLGFMLEGALAALAQGDATLLAAGAPDVAPPPSEALKALGGVQLTAWLGRAPRMRDPKLADFFEVYAVEFSSGERLCGIHQSPYGKIDGLLCV
jgi:hypothetical protein